MNNAQARVELCGEVIERLLKLGIYKQSIAGDLFSGMVVCMRGILIDDEAIINSEADDQMVGDALIRIRCISRALAPADDELRRLLEVIE